MILVTLGTQDKSFARLLDAIQEQIDNGIIKTKVTVQAGYTKYESDDMEIMGLIPMDEFDKLIKDCNILITHGGVASIITGIKNDKKVIAAARLKKYKEHTNDHQEQIIKHLEMDGYIKALSDFDELGNIVESIHNFVPKKYESNTHNMIKLIKEYVDKN